MKTIKEYSEQPFSFSFLRNFAISPKNALAYINREFKPTPALEFGRMVHSLFAGQFDQEFIQFNELERPEIDKTMASNKNKAWKRSIIEECEDAKKTLVSMDDYATGLQMIEAIKETKVGREIMEANCEIEQTFKNDIYTGRLDMVWHDRKLIIDLKTTVRINVDYLPNDMRKYNTDSQASLYSKLLPGYDVMLLFVEKSEPFNVLPVLIEQDSETMRNGSAKLSIWTRQAKECFETGEWGGISSLYPDQMMYAE